MEPIEKAQDEYSDWEQIQDEPEIRASVIRVSEAVKTIQVKTTFERLLSILFDVILISSVIVCWILVI